MCKVFAIYPTDRKESTQFLNRINTYLSRTLKEDWHCYKIRYTDRDHETCINKSTNSKAKLIIFMGHGRSDCLYGSFAKDCQDFASPDVVIENQCYYKNEHFIHSDNIGLFENKIFFSLSCFSNKNDYKSIGRHAINNGVTCFIGFGDIPTDYIEGHYFPLKAIAIYKGIISRVIKNSIYLSISRNDTVEGLVSLIKILITKEIQSIILSSHKNRHKGLIINQLFKFKDEILILGNRYERLI